MSGRPYRSAEPREPAGAPPSARPALGPRLSSHYRADLQGVTARVLRWSAAVDVQEGGLVFLAGTPEHQELLFDDIDAIFFEYESLLLRARPQLQIVSGAGKRCDLARGLSGQDALLTVLHRKVTLPIVASVKEALHRGEPMTFGPLGVELEGLRFRDELLPWSLLKRVIVDWDTLAIYGREPIGRFGWLPLRSVPHPRALVATLRLRGEVVLRGRTTDPG